MYSTSAYINKSQFEPMGENMVLLDYAIGIIVTVTG